MRVTVNGEHRDTAAESVAALLRELEYEGTHFAVAVNADVVPRARNRFFVGATSIESEDGGVTVRSVLELLTAAYAVHPAFAEARIVEIGAALRPAFPDNLPRIAVEGRRIGVNGLYRHGFLLAPALAELTLAYVARGALDNEVMRCA